VFRKFTPLGRLTTHAMSAQGLALVVKAAALNAGCSPALFSGHPMRAGLRAEAGRENANLFKMREHSLHSHTCSSGRQTRKKAPEPKPERSRR
jgi:hypothetical protein